jgi:CheY-like chemotaxis protein
MDQKLITSQVADAFLHIYDLVYLRTHPLADFVTPSPEVRRKKKAWLLHDVLLGLIEELDPGHQAPADGREKRRYRLLSLHYGEGMPSKAVADELAISLRHYYREHDTAIEAIATILWERYSQRQREERPSSALQLMAGDEAPDRQSMLRAEAAHFQNFAQKTLLEDVLAGVVALAQELMRAKGIHLSVEQPSDSSPLPMDRGMIRQILLGLLSYLGEQLAEGEIQVRVRAENQQQIVELVGYGPRVAAAMMHHQEEVRNQEEQIATLAELAALQSAQLEPLAEAEDGIGFRLVLPRVPRRTVLLVDDNGDILELYQRYLQQGHYQAVPVQSGAEALMVASELRPQAIVLDLMLPEQDGWEILQRLTNHPDTQAIPVVICSILRARQLALALGAAAFLEKPVDEMEFLEVLETLTTG